jgi:capsular polysaccharide export protein
LWADDLPLRTTSGDVIAVSGECDPWHMLAGASALLIERGDDLQKIAALLGVACYEIDRHVAAPADLDPLAVGEELAAIGFEDPFFGSPMNAIEAAELCGFWRRLVDSNRMLAGGVGFAFWKQAHVAPLLWGGAGQFRFLRNADLAQPKGWVAIWRSKTPDAMIAQLERSGSKLVEVEDGFLRSRGLGADCVPPLSITVDRLGPHFDPGHATELERLLETGTFDTATKARAHELRSLIVEAGIGKYERGTVSVARPAGSRRHILVPGQVEDDRAVTAGGCGLRSNLELLKRVREQAPDAFIIYKPHPDVLAGHRRGSIPEATCLRFADQIVTDVPIAALIAMVDEVHVNTSLAGFEALLREKKVTTYGVPFYAGWGLTRDLGPVPSRRTARRTLDELVAATLLIYPRYVDPLTGLPCPAEVIVDRLSAADERKASLLVGMRRFQGKLMRRLRSVIQ